jgi:SNF2 family DNA or RNA helicase
VLIDTTRYYHAVTRSKSRIQESEIGGGILADEMGMGKSLSILALIANTLKASYDWARSQTSTSPDWEDSNLRNNRATLVIVPSASRLFDGSVGSITVTNRSHSVDK